MISDHTQRNRNFTGIQQSHVISTEGYKASPLSTGYDAVIAQRVDDIFAVTVSKPGKVIEVTDKHVVIEHDDGEISAHTLETQYGVSVGTVYPHPQATTLVVGDTVVAGDTVTYNSGFFQPSLYDRKQVIWKAGVIAKTVIGEAPYTLEDSSAINPWLAEKMITKVTKVKTIVVRFDQSIRHLVKPGDSMDLESVLCTIEDSSTADNNLFDEETLDSLRFMSSATPRAGVVGVVDKLEVFYNGDIDDMSDSLLVICQAGDKDRKQRAKRLNEPPITGQVDQSLRIDGNGLEYDQVAIKIYITTRVGASTGDKLVFCNQMKTVVGHMLSGINETESGVEIDAIFGAKSIMDRIVLSPLLIGMTNTLLRVIGENAADMWLSDDT